MSKTFAIAIAKTSGGNTIYTGDGNILGDRIVNLNSNQLTIMDGSNTTGINIEPQVDAEQVSVRIRNHTNPDTYGFLNQNVSGGISINTTLFGSYNDSEKEFSIIGQAQAGSSTLEYKADTHTFEGDIALANAGDKINIANGSNASIGEDILSSGTVTVNTTAVTSSSLIFVVYNTPSGTLASGLSAPSGSIVDGTSFVINSLTTAGIVNTFDNSTVRWWIIN